jgi:exodeoxyribonuclease VII large subunit
VRELRASARRGVAERRGLARTHGLVLDRKATATASPRARAGWQRWDAFALALAAHDPDRTLARGYALVQNDAGELVTGVEAARAAGRVDVRFHDGAVRARVEDDET